MEETMPNPTPNRRALLRGAALLAAGGGLGLADFGRAGAQTNDAAGAVRYSAGTGKPRSAAPAHATDCHHHVYSSAYKAAANAVLLPPNASVDDYRALQRRIGTTRNVIVHPSTYGTDNSITLDALAAMGADTRAVAVVNTSVTDAELDRLHTLGVRGIRFNLAQKGATTIDMVIPLSERVRDLGWHCQVNMSGPDIVAAQDVFLRVRGNLVFDHLAHVPEPAGLDSPTYALIRTLLDKGNTWIKLSGAYADTKLGPPTYADSTVIAKAYVAQAPSRMVWGSDWPHPTEALDKKPDDAVLFDLLTEWAPNEPVRHQILVENPAVLYDFPKS
jgi:D-galactarolactone isomerase